MNSNFIINDDGSVKITDLGSKILNKYKIMQAAACDNNIIALAEALKNEGLNKKNTVSAILEMSITDGYGRLYTAEKILKIINGFPTEDRIEPAEEPQLEPVYIKQTAPTTVGYCSKESDPAEYNNRILNLINEFRDKGDSYELIANKLNDLGLKTINNKIFYANSVRQIFIEGGYKTANIDPATSSDARLRIIQEFGETYDNIELAKIMYDRGLRTARGVRITPSIAAIYINNAANGQNGAYWKKEITRVKNNFHLNLQSIIKELPFDKFIYYDEILDLFNKSMKVGRTCILLELRAYAQKNGINLDFRRYSNGTITAIKLTKNN